MHTCVYIISKHMHLDIEGKIMGKVKLICIIRTRSTQPIQIYLLMQSALLNEPHSFIVYFCLKTTESC